MGGSNPHELTKAGGKLFFAAFDAAHGDELFKSDGTAAGTTLIKDINPGGPSSDSYLTELTGVGDTLFFTATVKFDERGFPVDFELWKSNATAAGTKLVKPGGAVDPRYLTGVRDRLFYSARGPHVGCELRSSDGTAAGTQLVRDINPGPASSDPYQLTNIAGRLFFQAHEPTHGVELWKAVP